MPAQVKEELPRDAVPGAPGALCQRRLLSFHGGKNEEKRTKRMHLSAFVPPGV